MLHSSIPLGRWLGVQVRVHLSLVLLLALAVGYSVVATGSALRGFALWLALCAAILVREIARAIAAAYLGLPLRALYLLPIGGVMALAPRQGGLPTGGTRTIGGVGSLANLVVASLLVGFAYGVDPHVRLFVQPWIGIQHILRSAVWLQLVVGGVNLLPSAVLPGRPLEQARPGSPSGSLTRSPTGSPAGSSTGSPSDSRPGAHPFPALPTLAGMRAAFSLWTAVALSLMLSGLLFGLLWPVLLGLTLLLTSFLNRASGPGSLAGVQVQVRDVMLTEYKSLHASSTLRDALRQTTNTVQELFPVLRGERLVGWTSRASLLAKLRADGDGFLQGVMTRSFQSVSPGEKLGEALRRASALGAAEFIPVVEGGAMVGMLTPSSLERAVGQFLMTQATTAERDDR